jgi:hypothetical protein
MKNLQFILLLFFICVVNQTSGEKVLKGKAQKVATNWHENKIGRKIQKDLLKSDCYISDGDTALFIFNFENDGFVIVSGDDNTFPILGYNTQGFIDLDDIPEHFLSWLEYYDHMVNSNKKRENKNKKIEEKWEEIEQNVFLKSTSTTVPSLMESSGSSRWATWTPYFNAAPANPYGINKGYNGCVPNAMSQIMKYYEFPPLGTGSKTYTYNGLTKSEDLNEFFDYNLMPFRLTYCANGYPNCDDDHWGILPGITQEQIDAVGKLQYMAGMSVEMHWIASFDTATYKGAGTYGVVDDWALAMVDYFYYDANYTYWDTTNIVSNPSGFKADLRSSLDNGHPAIFRYNHHPTGGGHAVVIDGYEDDEFFHFCVGRGGYCDGYFYLFTSDADGIHDPREDITYGGVYCALNIHPDCNIPSTLTMNNQTISSASSLNRASNSLTVFNVTVEDGAKAYFGANSVTITSNFEVELGAELLIDNKPCGN